MEGWRAQRVYVRRAALWVAVSERRTVLPISGERPHCMFRISCLLFAEIADIAKGGRWCHAFPVFLRFHTWIGYHPPRFIWGSPIVKGKRNACIWDVLFDKEWFTLSVYIEKAFITHVDSRIKERHPRCSRYVCGKILLLLLWIRVTLQVDFVL